MTINPSSALISGSPGGCGQCLCHRCPHIYLTHRHHEEPGRGRDRGCFYWLSGQGGEEEGKYHQTLDSLNRTNAWFVRLRNSNILNIFARLYDVELYWYLRVAFAFKYWDERSWIVLTAEGLPIVRQMWSRDLICKYNWSVFEDDHRSVSLSNSGPPVRQVSQLWPPGHLSGSHWEGADIYK